MTNGIDFLLGTTKCRILIEVGVLGSFQFSFGWLKELTRDSKIKGEFRFFRSHLFGIFLFILLLGFLRLAVFIFIFVVVIGVGILWMLRPVSFVLSLRLGVNIMISIVSLFLFRVFLFHPWRDVLIIKISLFLVGVRFLFLVRVGFLFTF